MLHGEFQLKSNHTGNPQQEENLLQILYLNVAFPPMKAGEMKKKNYIFCTLYSVEFLNLYLF